MKFFNLKYKDLFLEIYVDEEDYEWLKEENISVTNNGINQDKFYLTIPNKNGGKEYLHRAIMKRYYCIDEFEIDHIDRNTLNNQKSNLRLATHRQNSINCGPQVNNSVGYKGVTKVRRKFQAVLSLENQKIYMGAYSNPKDAAIAYDIAAKKYFGEFAYLNFPDASEEEIKNVESIFANSKKNNRTSIFKGISQRKNDGRWIANIKVDNNQKYIGCFKTESDAVKAYNKKAVELYGDKAIIYKY